MEEKDFQELMTRVLNEDQAAIRRFMELFDPIFRLTMSVRSKAPILQSVRDTDDNVNSLFGDLFTDQWLRPLQGKPFAEVRKYLFVVAVRRLLYHIRKERAPCRDAARRVPLEEGAEVVGREQLPPDAAASAEEVKRVIEAFRRIGGNRFPAYERLWQGESYVEVAASCGIKVSTLHYSYLSTLSKVRDFLAKEST